MTNDLKWNKNTRIIIKKAYAIIELLRKMTTFTKSQEDKLHIYKTYIRSVLEQSCVVWNAGISKQNERELERVQKVSVRLISGKYESYTEALKKLELETLKERREFLSNRFSEKCVDNDRTKHMFEIIRKKHNMKLRNSNKYQSTNARTARMERSAIPRMIKHLNLKHRDQKIIQEKYTFKRKT